MGLNDFWRGIHNRAGSHLVTRSIQGQLDYETGRRIGGRRSRVDLPGADLWAPMTVLKWTGIGMGGGALVLSALVAAAGLAILAAIFWGLGILLNFLTSL